MSSPHPHSRKEPQEKTLVDLFFQRAEAGKDSPFLFERRARQWHEYSWDDISETVLLCAAALRARGISGGMRVAIISENRHEWVVADLAIMLIGAISVPLFTSQTGDDYSYLLTQSGARAAICSTSKIAYQVEPAAQASPNCLFMVVMRPGKIFHSSLRLATVTWKDFLEEGRQAPAVTPEDRHHISETDVACIIYNSGATQKPKGVMLTHKSIIANLKGIHDWIAPLSLGKERVLSFLPLSHAYEHTVGLYYPMHIQAEIYYLPRPELLSTAMLEVKPTLMTAVPRMFDLLKERLEVVFRQKGPLSAMLFARAIRTPSQKTLISPLRFTAWLERLFLNRVIAKPVKNRLGGDLKAFISGGAALNPEVSHFFNALNVRLLQGYGLTEASPVVSVNPVNNIKRGTVGLPLSGAEVQLSKDGELLVKGEMVMAGYWDDPAATRQRIKKGWLHTGDLASIDEEGHISILGVKRDMIVNSGGENISPLRVELVLHSQPAIEQAIIFGDSKPYLTAVLTASQDIKQIAESKDNPANWLEKTLSDAIQTANANLSPPERVRHFIVSDEPFSHKNGLASTTGTYHRSEIIAQYRARLEALYLKRR